MPSSLDLTLGALEVGTLLSSMLLGITTVQVYVYWQRKFDDGIWLQLLVAGVWVLELCHTIFVWIYLYRLTVTFYGVPAMLIQPHWTFDTSALFDGIIGALVQGYFAYRVLLLSRQWYIPVASWIGSIVQLTGTVAVMVVGSLVSTVEFAERFEWIVTVSLVFNVCVDVLNTTALCWCLYNGRTGFHSTDRLLDTLILWSVETGLLTVIAAIVMLVLSLAEKGTSLWVAVSLFYAKLYSNSFLASLNGRDILRRSKEGSTGNTSSSGPRLQVSIIHDREVELDTIPSSRTNYRFPKRNSGAKSTFADNSFLHVDDVSMSKGRDLVENL